VGIKDFILHTQSHTHDWVSVAVALWNKREKNKARMLSELADYFVDWHHKNMPAASEIEALRKWALSTKKSDFVGQIKGLASRAHEQLLWYLEGKQTIKFDRHVESFVGQVVGRPVTDEEAIQALRQIAGEIGISATALDARIWDYMQSRSKHLRNPGRDVRQFGPEKCTKMYLVPEGTRFRLLRHTRSWSWWR
jgi:hypothetical protein